MQKRWKLNVHFRLGQPSDFFLTKHRRISESVGDNLPFQILWNYDQQLFYNFSALYLPFARFQCYTTLILNLLVSWWTNYLKECFRAVTEEVLSIVPDICVLAIYLLIGIKVQLENHKKLKMYKYSLTSSFI